MFSLELLVTADVLDALTKPAESYSMDTVGKVISHLTKISYYRIKFFTSSVLLLLIIILFCFLKIGMVFLKVILMRTISSYVLQLEKK